MSATGWGIKEGNSLRRLEDKPPYLPLGVRKELKDRTRCLTPHPERGKNGPVLSLFRTSF